MTNSIINISSSFNKTQQKFDPLYPVLDKYSKILSNDNLYTNLSDLQKDTIQRTNVSDAKSSLSLSIKDDISKLDSSNLLKKVEKAIQMSSRGRIPQNLGVYSLTIFYSETAQELLKNSSNTNLVNSTVELCDMIKKITACSLLNTSNISKEFLFSENLEVKKVPSKVIDQKMNDLFAQGHTPYFYTKVLKIFQEQFSSSVCDRSFVSRSDRYSKLCLEYINKEIYNGSKYSHKELYDFLEIEKKQLLLSQLEEKIKVFFECLWSTEISFDLRCFLISLVQSLIYVNRGVSARIDLSKDEYIFNECVGGIGVVENTPVDDSVLSKVIPEMDEAIERILNKGILSKIPTNFDLIKDGKVFTTNKSGPNGSLALTQFPFDCYAVSKNPEVKENILRFSKLFGVTGIEEIIESFSNSDILERFQKIKKNDSKPIDSSSYNFIELGAKLRSVTSADILTQSLLSAILQEPIKAWLKSDPDLGGVFDQDKSWENIQKEILLSKEAFCDDCQAASDNMPVLVQSNFVEKYVYKTNGIKGAGKLWLELVTQREFIVSNPGINHTLNYRNKGQPMGTVFSFLAMHINNLIICEIAKIRCESEGMVFKNQPFTVCGDDSATSNERISYHYNIIMEGLSVPIHKQKSTKQKSQVNPLFWEYLKIFSYGEYSFKALSPRRFINFLNNPSDHIFGLVKNIITLGWKLNLQPYLKYTLESIIKQNSIDDTTDSDVKEVDISKWLINFYAFLVASNKLGGLNLSIIHVESYFGKNIFRNIYPLFKDVEFSNKHYLVYLNSVNLRILKMREEQFSKSLKTLFTKDGYNILNNLSLEKVVDYDNLVETALFENFSQVDTGFRTREYPILMVLVAQLILKGLLKGKQDRLDYLKKTKYLIELSQINSEISSKELDKMILISKEVKKTDTYVLDSFLVPEDRSSNVEVHGLNHTLISHLLNVSRFKSSQRRERLVDAILFKL